MPDFSRADRVLPLFQCAQRLKPKIAARHCWARCSMFLMPQAYNARPWPKPPAEEHLLSVATFQATVGRCEI